MRQRPSTATQMVAPRAGAWIETRRLGLRIRGLLRSPPARGRGLKLTMDHIGIHDPCVAPRAGAWIETTVVFHVSQTQGRPPRGGVD